MAIPLILTALQSSPKIENKPLDFSVDSISVAQSYDEAVLKPLHEAQTAKAEKDRLAAIEAARQAEIARQKRLKEVADRMKPPGTYGNSYYWGHCTRLIASMIQIGNWGNASTWDDRARAAGWTVSSEPIVGAIAQTDEGYWGHVAGVVGINGRMVHIIEENYLGLGVISYRTVDKSAFKYIY